MALAEKQKGTGAIVTVFVGDGTFGEGIIYEAFNMARLWALPLLIVVEHNHIAQTTPTELVQVGQLADRMRSFEIPVNELDSSDVDEIHQAALNVAGSVRRDQLPSALLLHTVRFGPHSKGDDTRDEAELRVLQDQRDPLKILGQRLSPAALTTIHEEVDQKVSRAFAQALADPPAVLEGGRNG